MQSNYLFELHLHNHWNLYFNKLTIIILWLG